MRPPAAEVLPSAESDVAGVSDSTSGSGSGSDIDRITEAVLTASRLLVAVSARSLQEAEDRLTLPQFRALIVLSTRGPLRLTGLAERLAVSSSTALRLAERLHIAGMIDRAPNPQNHRESILSLTPLGRQCVAKVTERRRTEIAAVVARMSVPDREHLVEALEAFSAAGDEPPAGSGHGLYPLGWE
jgi:DNA-binding MarR family transcriptional regulator